MYAKVEPSGCGEFHGNVKGRFSFYLKTSDAGYWHTFGQVPIIPPEGYPGERTAILGMPVDQEDYKNWLMSLPKKWQLVPFHNHFIYADPDVTEVEIEALAAFHLPNFYKAWCEGLPLLDAGKRKPGWMRRGWDVKTRIRPLRYEEVDEPDIFALRKAQCLERAESLKSLSIAVSSLGEGEIFPATEIDIGADATNRGLYVTGGGTNLDLANPANDTGTIDTIDIWAQSEMSDTKAGTFHGTAPNYTCRDFETIGTVTVPSNQTPQSFTGLDCDVSTDDIIGAYWSSGNLEADSAGGAGRYYKIGDYFEAGEQTYTLSANNAMSLYGSGETVAVNIEIAVPLATVDSAGVIPSLVVGINLTVPLATIDSAGVVPIVGAGVGIAIPLATIDSSGLVPTVGGGAGVAVPLATVDSAGVVPTLIIDSILGIPLATIDSAGLIPAVGGGAGVVVPLATIDSAGLVPSLVVGINLAIPLATVDSAGVVPTVIIGINLAVPLATITATGLTPTLIVGINLTIPVATITALGLIPFIDLYFIYLTLYPRTFSLTLQSRDFALTPQPRLFALTLQSRDFALTLSKRVFSFTVKTR